jgi:hypothetical protein
MPTQTSVAEPPNIPTTIRYFLVSHVVNDSLSHKHILQVLKEADKIENTKDETEIDVFLTSLGGNVHAAYQIVNVLRAKCARLQVVIPYFAKSAATLLALGADRLIMGPQSELGPLDVQMEHPTQKDVRISAIDTVRPLEYLAGVAAAIADDLGVHIWTQIGLPRDEAIQLALKFATDYISHVVSQCDPSLVSRSFRELTVARRYGEELLSTYMLKDELGKQSADIAHKLVFDYPSHQFVIGINEACRLGLEICEATQYDYWQAAWDICMSLGDMKSDLVHLFNEQELDDFVQGLSTDLVEEECHDGDAAQGNSQQTDIAPNNE